MPFPERHLPYKSVPNKQPNYNTISFNTNELGILSSALRLRRNFLDKKNTEALSLASKKVGLEEYLLRN